MLLWQMQNLSEVTATGDYMADPGSSLIIGIPEPLTQSPISQAGVLSALAHTLAWEIPLEPLTYSPKYKFILQVL